MATLYVENFPDDIYEALRERARRERSSIAAQVILVMKESVPTESELAKRREWMARILKLHANHHSHGQFPSTEEMIREDRER